MEIQYPGKRYPPQGRDPDCVGEDITNSLDGTEATMWCQLAKSAGSVSSRVPGEAAGQGCSWLPHPTGTGHWRRHTLRKSLPENARNQEGKPAYPPAVLLYCPLPTELNTVELQRKRGPDQKAGKGDTFGIERPQIKKKWHMWYGQMHLGNSRYIYLGKDTCVPRRLEN